MLKIMNCEESRISENHEFFKITNFLKSRIIQNHEFFKITNAENYEL